MEISVHVFNISEPKFAGLYSNGGGSYSPENLPTTSHGVQHNTPAKEIVAMILHAAGGLEDQDLAYSSSWKQWSYEFPHLWNVNLISTEYQKLRAVFAPNARFEMHGCGIASETSILKPGVDIRDATVSNTVPGRFSGGGDWCGSRVPAANRVRLLDPGSGWNQCPGCVASKLAVRGEIRSPCTRMESSQWTAKAHEFGISNRRKRRRGK